jgi:hypothetical protein
VPLPFLKPKQAGIATLIVKNRTPDQKPEEKQEDSIQEHAKKLLSAIHAQDASAMAECLKEMFIAFDKEPHTEGEHVEPHSYDAQKEE